MFSIQCGSCGAKLKVAKLELIGQTLACPRCGSMVQVEPPEGWEPPPNLRPTPAKPVDPSKQPVAKRRRDQPAPTTPGPEDLQETLPNVGSLGWGEELKLADVEPDVPAAHVEKTAAKTDSRAGATHARPTGNRSTSSAKEKATPDDLLRPENWDSAKTRQRRTILLAMIGGLGLLVLFGTVGYYWWEQRTRLAELEKAPTKQPASDEADNSNQAPGPDTDGDANTDGDSGAKVGDPTAPDSNTNAQPVVDPNEPPPDSNLKVPDPDQNAATNPDAKVDQDAADTDSASPPSQPAAETVGKEATDDLSVDGGFQDVMDKIFEDGLTSEWDDPRLRDLTQGAADPIDDVLRTFAQSLPSRSRSPRVVKPLPRETDTRRGMTAKIAGFRQEQGRVPQLLSLAEALSGLPVWIDIQRYEGQPSSLDETRLMEAVQTTIPDLLLTQLEPFGFAMEQHAWNPNRPEVFGLRVFPIDSDKMTAIAYSADWLTADLPAESIQAELPKVGAFLTQYVGRGQWGEMVADAESNPEAQRAMERGALQIRDGKILVVHYPAIQKKIARVLRQLTLSKLNQGQPQGWPDELLPKAVQESGRLQTVINLLNHQPTPLRDIFQQIHKQSNVTVLIDWPSLIQEGWTPDTAVPIVAENQVVADVLRELCLDMGLSLRSMAPDVVCLLSDSAEESHADVEVYPVADLCPSGREWPVLRGRLMRLLEQDIQRYPSTYLYYDPDFKAIVASMPQSCHQRLHVYLRAARRQ